MNDLSPNSVPFVVSYNDLINNSFAHYLKLSATIGGPVKAHSEMVKRAVTEQKQFLTIASKSKQPNDASLMTLLKPTSECLTQIQDFRNKNRTHELFNHLSAVSESISALGWVMVTPTPGPYVKEMNDAAQFYTNKVLVTYKEKDKTHIDWARSWLTFLTDLQAYIKQYHTTGLVWNPRGGDLSAQNGSGPAPPPPPPAGFFDSPPQVDSGRSALLQQLNQGTDITKSLKKVTADQQTHKNQGLRAGPAPYKPPVASKPTAGRVSPPKGPSKMSLEGKKWMVEYQIGQKNLVIGDTEMKQSVVVYKCEDSVLQVKGKVNSITVDSCKKFSIVFESTLAVVEFINCQRIQAQVTGVVPIITFDKTDGVELYLNKESLKTEIFSSKCSELNVSVPNQSGDYKEHPIPEQFKTQWNGKGFTTVSVEKA